MKRRLFLGLLGSAGVAGPKTLAKAAAPAGLETLALGAVTSGTDLHDPMEFDNNDRRKESAKKWLKRLLGTSKEEDEFNARSYFMHQMDPDTAALRSMSVCAKMARTQRIQYYRQKRMQERRYRGILSNMFTGDAY